MPPKSEFEIHHLAKCITCHAFNGDKSRLALCPNDNTVTIYKRVGKTWEVEHVLNEHDQVVTGIDWAPKTNCIVTCSQDRNAYVWKYENERWKPTLVILRLNRAATYVRWSPNEDKFAVASGAKCVSVCYFEEGHDWWVSKHIKKHRSTVLKVDWHPNNLLVLTASSDFRCRVFSAFVKGVDTKPEGAVFSFGAKLPFGEMLLELDSAGWVHSAKWSPDGATIAFCGHDSCITFADIQTSPPPTQVVRFASLPLLELLWLNNTQVIGIGHDNAPLLFANEAGTWKYLRNLDEKEKPKAGPGGAAAGAPGNAFSMFQNKVNTGQEGGNDTVLTTRHQNCANCLTTIAVTGKSVTEFASSGLDGNVIFWDCKSLGL